MFRGDNQRKKRRITLLWAGRDSFRRFYSDRRASAISLVRVRRCGRYDEQYDEQYDASAADRHSARNEYDHGYGEFWKPDATDDSAYAYCSLGSVGGFARREIDARAVSGSRAKARHYTIG